MSSSSYTFSFDEKQTEKLKEILLQRGFDISPLNHGLFRATTQGVVIQAYKTGKILVQGKEALEFAQGVIEPEILGKVSIGYEEVLHPEYFEAHAGIDECGKGDLFGPLVVAAVFVDKQSARFLIDAGIKDSKRIKSDSRLFQLAMEVKKKTPYGFFSLSPLQYNDLYEKKFKNLNLLLAWAHAKAYQRLLQVQSDCHRVVCDRFAHPWVLKQSFEKIGMQDALEQMTKAESDPAVAAASILARAIFLEELSKLGKEIGFSLLRGASSKTVEQAREIYLNKGKEALRKVAKMHFKTIQKILPETSS